jgi:hypothetical protein
MTAQHLTTYRLEVTCEDLGEYDGTFLADLATRAAELLRETGVIGFAVGTSRRREDEGWSR